MTASSFSSRSSDPGVLSGDLIAGKYRLEHEIGRGAMGTVWLATHLTLEQRVAIKIISPEHAGSDELRQRFDTEAKAAAKLRSRYVVGVHDHGETSSGLPFIVLEYLEGECLEDRIAREGSLPVGDTVRIARHVGRALSRAHAHRIIHRDLKPANIFLANSDDDEQGWTAKVLDFGIAKMASDGDGAVSTTRTGAVLGTPLFMSPEQVRRASEVDHRTDLYSLGMVVYNMLTGACAFDGASFGDLLVSICTEPLPKLRDAAPWVPGELEKWFERACARNPEDRFVDADEMIEALVRAAGLTGQRASLVDAPTLIGVGKASSTAVTVPGTPLSSPDPSVPPSSPADSSADPSSISSAGPATVTVHPSSRRRSSWPWIAGAAVLLTAAAIALLWPTADPAASTAAGAPQRADEEHVEGPDDEAPLATENAQAEPPASNEATTDAMPPLSPAEAKTALEEEPSAPEPPRSAAPRPTPRTAPARLSPSPASTGSTAKARTSASTDPASSEPEPKPEPKSPPAPTPPPLPDLGF